MGLRSENSAGVFHQYMPPVFYSSCRTIKSMRKLNRSTLLKLERVSLVILNGDT